MPIFGDDTDRRIFMIELRDACRHYGVELHAYCLLSNHFHLLMHTPAARLSATMQRLASRYTQIVNKRHLRDGPIFRGRFKSVTISDDAQLTHVTRYIHLNPVEAGLAETPASCPWSSAAAYLGAGIAPEWLVTDFLLSMFGGADAPAVYSRFLASGSDPGAERPR